MKECNRFNDIGEVRANYLPVNELIPLPPSGLVSMDAGGLHPLLHVASLIMVVIYCNIALKKG